jgi:hypothetical protein
VVVKDGQALKRQGSARTAQDAKVFIADHHEGYISWDAYQRHRETMRGNGANFIRDDMQRLWCAAGKAC